MKQIERLGERIRIRSARLEDAEARFRWFSDAAVTEFLAGERALPMESIVEFLGQAIREDNPNPSVGIDLPSGRTIGCGGLRNIVANDSAELSVVIGEREFWGLGFGEEVMSLLLEEAFTELNLRTVWLIVREDNARAVRLFSGLGFAVTETLMAAVVVRGVSRDKLRMQLAATTWRMRRGGL